MITSQKKEALARRMTELAIYEADLEESFVQGSGKGGQKVNKTASCVILKHPPTDTLIKCQKTRSREDNRYFARRQLCEAVDQKLNGKQSEAEKQFEKIRKQKARRKRKSKSKESL